MKFARYLLVLERDAPSRWNGKFIRYKQLKKKLKLCRPAEGSPAVAVIPEREEEFFDALRKELAATNRHFQSEAGRTVAAFQRTVRGCRLLCCFVPLGPSGPRQCAALADRAYWCRKYARANAVALRKILKKHDKLCGTDNGRRFLQECWSSSSQEAGVGLFLHSPLLDELKAIQDVLQRRAEAAENAGEVAEHDSAPASHGAGAPAEAGSAGAAGKRPGLKAATGGQPAAASLEVATERPAVAAPQPSSASAAIAASLAPLEATNAQQHAIAHPATAPPSMDGMHSGGVALSINESVSNSFTSPSLRAQRDDGLAAIVEDPACMLDSSEVEWGRDGAAHARLASAAPWDALDGPLMLPQRRQKPQGEGRGQPTGQRGGRAERERVSGEWDPDAPVQRPPSAAESKLGLGEEDSGGGVVGGSAGDSGVGPAVGPFSDEDLQCPICLDVLYKPVGLGCGHKFCRPCALTAAGFGDTIGAFHNIVPYIPDRTPCPHCRQKNVYHSAVMLKEVGALIRERCPEEWEQRREEDKQRVRMRAAAPEREAVRSAMRTNIYDVLLGTGPE